MNSSHPFDLVVGCDRSDAKVDLCRIETATGSRRSLSIGSSPESLFAWAAQLHQEFPQARVAVCVEQPAMNILAFLEAYDWITLFAVNPITLQKFREAFVTSRAKDDTRDAEFLAELVLVHHEKLISWTPEDSSTRRLHCIIVQRRGVVDERTALTNRLQAILKQYFPQALDFTGPDLWRPICLAFLLKWPTLQALQKVDPAQLRRFYRRHGSRSSHLLEERLALLAKAVPLTDEAALLETYSLRVQLICRQLKFVVQAIEEYEESIATLYRQHPDRAIFAELPGAGAVLAPRLLASMGSRRERYPEASSLQCYSGVAPITKRSGKSCKIQRRYLCPKFMRQSFHEYAKSSILHCRWAAAYFQQQTERGSAYHTAVRALAYKWQRIIWKCWQDRTRYSDAIYEASLKRHNSPLFARLAGIEVGKMPPKNSTDEPKKSLVGSPQR